MGFGGGSKPQPLPPPPAPAPAPTIDTASAEQQRGEDNMRKRQGRAATILTGAQGDLSAPTTGTKQLLGQ